MDELNQSTYGSSTFRRTMTKTNSTFNHSKAQSVGLSTYFPTVTTTDNRDSSRKSMDNSITAKTKPRVSKNRKLKQLKTIKSERLLNICDIDSKYATRNGHRFWNNDVYGIN